MADEQAPAAEGLTVSQADADFKLAHQAKRKLIEREREDFLFALGKQWSDDDLAKLKKAGVNPVTDNRIAPNIFLLTGMERQNRAEFRAFPEGMEDGLKADIASMLLKDAIKKSGFLYKSSDQFKDGITCGESHLEPYLDYTESLLNGKPCWKKLDGEVLFPDPASREYDFSDARYVYKVTLDIDKGDLINLYPEKRAAIEACNGGRLDLSSSGSEGTHTQKKDYGKEGGNDFKKKPGEGMDLVERYYKKHVEAYLIGDYKTGHLTESKDKAAAEAFIAEYRQGIELNQAAYGEAMAQAQMLAMAGQAVEPPPAPPEQDPDRFKVLPRMVPEIWVYAYIPGMDEPLANERAWFYPKWKSYPFVPYFARFSTAPLTGDDKHLLVQGLVHGVKGAQEMLNKAETLMIRHMNASTNSGWLTEEGAWVDPEAVKNFGTAPGVNLEHKKGTPKPERIGPMALSPGHADLAAQSAESIKAQSGINSDLLSSEDGNDSSGRAIHLRLRQGTLMVQEPLDNHSRSRKIAGRFLLSQLGEIYDTESASKVLGEAFLTKNFPAPMVINEQTMQPEPMPGEDGQPMAYDKQMAEVAIAEVLAGKLEEYDVSVGEAVASDTQKMAVAADIEALAKTYPGIVPPDVLIEHSQIPETAKSKIMASLARAQAMAQMGSGAKAPPPDGAEAPAA